MTDLSERLRAARAGDELAFRDVYRAVHPGLVRYLRGLVNSDVEDIASEAWLQIARDLHTFQGDIGAFRAWSVTIARHRALDHLRKERRQPQLTGSLDEFADRPAELDTATAALDAVATRDAIAMIACLPREQAEAVLLRVIVGLDARATGQVLSKRAGAVRTATYRGLRRLAEIAEPSTTGQGTRHTTLEEL